MSNGLFMADPGVALKEPPKTFWQILRQIGPGLIISANIVGSGELIATTLLGAEVGFVLLWFVMFSCFIKVFIQVELGRYAVSEGVSSLDAMNQLPGPRKIVSWCVMLWTLMYVGTLFQLSGMLGAISQVFGLLSGQGAAKVIVDPATGEEVTSWAHVGWVFFAAAAVATPLVAGRYRMVERFSTTMVVLFTFATLTAVFFVQGTSAAITGEEITSGLKFGFPEKFAVAFAVFGITGVGASELIYYPIWCIEKGYARYVGPRDDSREWLDRAKAWLRVMRVDAWVAMVIYTVATIAFYLLGAAVLHGEDIKVTDKTLISDLSNMYTRSYGQMGFWIFLVGAFMVLFSTLFVSTASNSRLFADASRLYRIIKYPSDERRQQVIKYACIGVPCFLVVVYLGTGQPVTLVLIGGFAQAMMLPFLGFAALYFRYKKVHPELRPGSVWSLFAVTSFVSFVVVGIIQVVKLWPKVMALFESSPK